MGHNNKLHNHQQDGTPESTSGNLPGPGPFALHQYTEMITTHSTTISTARGRQHHLPPFCLDKRRPPACPVRAARPLRPHQPVPRAHATHHNATRHGRRKKREEAGRHSRRVGVASTTERNPASDVRGLRSAACCAVLCLAENLKRRNGAGIKRRDRLVVVGRGKKNGANSRLHAASSLVLQKRGQPRCFPGNDWLPACLPFPSLASGLKLLRRAASGD
jgi:hypothetical protein